jgi:hypothetical protein
MFGIFAISTRLVRSYELIPAVPTVLFPDLRKNEG